MISSNHNLSNVRASTTLLHFPTSFGVDVKNTISWAPGQSKSIRWKKPKIYNSRWYRWNSVSLGAEINLKWFLQHRMQENLPTFFTSNFNLEGLERHLQLRVMEMKPGRLGAVMERVKLQQRIHLRKSQSPIDETIRSVKSHFLLPFLKPSKKLTSVLSAGQMASSSGNFQSPSVIVVKTGKERSHSLLPSEAIRQSAVFLTFGDLNRWKS